jgi:hypothetical protein
MSANRTITINKNIDVNINTNMNMHLNMNMNINMNINVDTSKSVNIHIEGCTQKNDFFSFVLFDTKTHLLDRKFYADFKTAIYF